MHACLQFAQGDQGHPFYRLVLGAKPTLLRQEGGQGTRFEHSFVTASQRLEDPTRRIEHGEVGAVRLIRAHRGAPGGIRRQMA